MRGKGKRRHLLAGLVAALALTTLAPTATTESQPPVGGKRFRTCQLAISYFAIPLMGYGRWAKVPIYATLSCGWYAG